MSVSISKGKRKSCLDQYWDIAFNPKKKKTDKKALKTKKTPSDCLHSIIIPYKKERKRKKKTKIEHQYILDE